MDKKKIRPRKGPEAKIQDDLVAFLRTREWHVMETHGNEFQMGFPDLYCIHASHRQRWVEVKNPLKYEFTPAQLDNFPIIDRRSSGIWILTAATEEEYKKLFGPPNWYQFLPIMKGR